MMNVDYNPAHIVTITHPQEKGAVLSIQNTVAYDYLAKLIGSVSVQAKTKADMVLTGYPVTEKTSPRLYRIYQTVLKRLHCDQKYDLFVDFGYDLMAKTYGSGKTGHLIKINSACLTYLNDSELAALLGHEIGHIQAEHIQTRELLDSLELVTKALPLASSLVKDTLWGFFAKWMVASEYTADRAALLACQNLEALTTLLLKQMGVTADREMIRRIYHQKMQKLPSKLGMFYVMMAQKMPSFGMVSRIQEVCRWAISAEFCEKYTYTHYLARLLLEDSVVNEQDEQLLLLHRRAASGNAYAQEKLGQLYLFGKGGLKMHPAVGIALLEEAAFSGNGNAMYIYSHCMSKKIHGLKHDIAVERQLQRAAASRVTELKDKVEVYREPSLTDLPVIVKTFTEKRRNVLQCIVNTSNPGTPLDSDCAQIPRDAFWMCIDEAVYCMDVKQIEDQWYGTAVSEKGIYGRMPYEKYPFFLTWKQFKNGRVVMQKYDGINYIFCDKQKLFQVNDILPGSMAEVLVAAKSLLDKV